MTRLRHAAETESAQSLGGSILSWLRRLAGAEEETDLRESSEEIIRERGGDGLTPEQREMLLNIADFGDGIKVLNGRFGPYITDGKKNAKIPKDKDPNSLTEEECKKLLEEAPARGKCRRFPSNKS